MTTEDWRSAVGAILDAVAREDDGFALDLYTAQGPDGAPLADLLPREALSTQGDDLDGWWTDTEAPQSEVWRRRGWAVLGANPAFMIVVFARMDGGAQGGGEQ